MALAVSEAGDQLVTAVSATRLAMAKSVTAMVVVVAMAVTVVTAALVQDHLMEMDTSSPATANPVQMVAMAVAAVVAAVAPVGLD